MRLVERSKLICTINSFSFSFYTKNTIRPDSRSDTLRLCRLCCRCCCGGCVAFGFVFVSVRTCVCVSVVCVDVWMCSVIPCVSVCARARKIPLLKSKSLRRHDSHSQSSKAHTHTNIHTPARESCMCTHKRLRTTENFVEYRGNIEAITRSYRAQHTAVRGRQLIIYITHT